ncbi:hypothetical protein BO226_24430 (plasmid) [Rhodococcus sp. 2G]|nr:hypothetical protein BO226_24430 [Rhodococcus sp. 2G]
MLSAQFADSTNFDQNRTVTSKDQSVLAAAPTPNSCQERRAFGDVVSEGRIPLQQQERRRGH